MRRFDCRVDPRFKEIFFLMGVEEVPPLQPIHFEKEVVFEDYDPLLRLQEEKISQSLAEGSIEATVDELDFSTSTIEYCGRKVLVYIQEQNKHIDYRFHVSNCATLKQMQNQGRSFRYRVTRRLDGRAPVYERHKRLANPKLHQMELCGHCRRILKNLGRYPSNFTFSKYFQQFHTDDDVRAYRSVRRGRRLETYTPDWAEISVRYREEQDWRCQVCRVCLEDHRFLLHVHHVNGNQMDNSHDNLRVLCVDCHSKQPRHGFMKGKYRADIERVRQIRLLQK